MNPIMKAIQNTVKFYDVAFPNEIPQWATENKIVIEHEAFLLRHFGTSHGTPTLIIPPQAGHHSAIADFDKKQSIVETVLKTRKGPVFAIEWLSATYERKDETIGCLIQQVNLAIEYIGTCHLIGLCQGGWLSSMYAAMFPQNIHSLTCIAAPIDFHGEGGNIYEMVMKLGLKPYESFVSLENGLMTGKNMLMGWKLMNSADRFLFDYLKIIDAIDDEKKLAKIKKFRIWYEFTQNLAGNWYIEAVEKLFMKNQLINKKFTIDCKVVDLENITCPIVMIAGEKDDITLTSHLFALEKYTSSKYSDKVVIPNCGHVGAFMGNNSQSYIAETIERLDKYILNNC